MYYDFKKMFLDFQYEESLLSLCEREKIITHNKFGMELKSWNKYIKNKQKTLCYLALFETVDFSKGIADLSPLVSRGIIAENSNCYMDKTIEFDKEFVEQADTLLRYSKKDVISKVTADFRRWAKKYKSSHSIWNNVDINKIWLGVENGDEGLRFAKDYEKIINNFDDLLEYNLDAECGNVYHDICVIRDSLIQGLYSSMTTDAVYASSFFRLHTSKQTQPIVDDIYYLVETKLPNEVNILPMPSTIDEALKMKNSPEMKSFRHVMSEWCYYYSTNEFGLAEKIQKDIVKANKQFERLERFKRFASSPYTQLVCLAGGCLPNPAIAYPIAFTGYIAPLIANAAQQKHIWAITTNRNLMK